MTNIFQIGDKVNTVRGKKIYTIIGQDQHGNYKMAEGGKFSGSYLRYAKTDHSIIALPVGVQVAEFFAEAAKIEWEAE